MSDRLRKGPGDRARVTSRELFSSYLLMDIGSPPPSGEAQARRVRDILGDGDRMTAFQLRMAERENGEISPMFLSRAKHIEALSAVCGFDHEKDFQLLSPLESRLRKRAPTEAEFRKLAQAELQRYREMASWEDEPRSRR